MPFLGILPERRRLFRPEPNAAVGVNDAHAWRLNPAHRHVYDKLFVACSQGLIAAPCGVTPMGLGIAPDVQIFVKPIINLAGMALQARSVAASRVPNEPGSFWCERLSGEHSSTDCLVKDGEVVWFAHTRASDAKDQERPIYWQVGISLPELEPYIAAWIGEHLAGYTGLCNVEMLGGRIFEVHLRGSNGFFDFYGERFMPAWVALVDGLDFAPPPAIPGGYVLSLFADVKLPPDRETVEQPGVTIQIDHHTPGRAAILRARDLADGLAALESCRASLR